MKFIDEAKIYVKAGDGGRGCISFRREKYVPRGGPDGGDGGKGGDVILVPTTALQTLLDLKYRQHHSADRGGHGGGNNRTGRNSQDIRIRVPVGTLVKDAETGELLADLTEEGLEFTVARGGIGGKGNAFFKTSTNQAPRFSQEGIPGEERTILLELKLLADVGIVGLPNVGKSTFISRVSAARPKIADYPFTTLVPNLGVVRYTDDRSFVVADIPGLIRGASEGHGMGIQFLRHIERTVVLLHILDISGEDEASGWERYETVNTELGRFNPSLLKKPQVVAVNKTDLTEVRERLQKEIDTFAAKGIKIHTFSAVTGEGLAVVLHAVAAELEKQREPIQ